MRGGVRRRGCVEVNMQISILVNILTTKQTNKQGYFL